MCKDEVIIFKRNVIPSIPDSMILMDYCKKVPVINFTTDEMKYNSEFFK